MIRATSARGSRAAVASGHPLATATAIGLLADGATVADAAVAAALVLAVVMPHACGLGGDAFLLIHDAASERTYGLNGTGCAPLGATPDAFAGGIPRTGIRSATVPGLLAALEEARARFGSRPLAALIAPALAAARDGFEVNGVLAANIRNRAELLARDAAASALFLPKGQPLPKSATLRQPELAATLAEIARAGPEAFYVGRIARGLIEGIRAAGGLFAADDLSEHRSLWQEPMRASFHGIEVVTQPPNSYGLTLLLQLIELERAGVGSLNPAGAEPILAGLAARRRAYALARPVIGDPAALEAPARALLAQALAGAVLGPEAAAPAGGGCTTNFVAIDRAGNAVSLITSISAPFGAGVVVPGTGIILNNRMGGFTLDAGSPNRVAPGKRPAHTLAPCLLFRDGAPWASLGTPGAAGQTATLAQVLVRRLALDQDWSAAIDAARWSVDLEGGFIVEDALAEPVLQALAAVEPGVAARASGFQTFGSIKAAWREADGVGAIADGRRAAAAAAI